MTNYQETHRPHILTLLFFKGLPYGILERKFPEKRIPVSMYLKTFSSFLTPLSSFYFLICLDWLINFFFFLEMGKGKARRRWGERFVVYSLVDPCLYPAQGSNPQHWYVETMR